MKSKDLATTFIDSPEPVELKEAITGWCQPDLPERLKSLSQTTAQEDFWELCHSFQESLDIAKSVRSKIQLQKLIVGWLFDFIRLNVKRGRVFDLREVLRTGKADCLGYCKIFTVLGRYCGLDAGVVDVIIDNRGLAVPHTVVLVKVDRLPSHRPSREIANMRGYRFIDFWYGSKNIHHKRLGLQVKRNGRWRIDDIDFKSIKISQDIRYLPDRNVDGINLYIQGNASLKKGDYTAAVKQYSQAIELYPRNSRAFYNRAIAHEKLGQTKKARADYNRAMQDEMALKRTLATQPEAIVDLIELDEKCIPELNQQTYLLHTGFVTGRRITVAKIARKLGLSLEKTEGILASIKDLVQK